MKLTKVDTIQQCSYCFDLKNVKDITPERLAKCFLHAHFRLQQGTAYLLDKKQLGEGYFSFSLIFDWFIFLIFVINLVGIFGERIFGESYHGAMLVVDYGVIKPSGTREEDFVIHVYTESESSTLNSKAIHTIGKPDQKLELLVCMQ